MGTERNMRETEIVEGKEMKGKEEMGWGRKRQWAGRRGRGRASVQRREPLITTGPTSQWHLQTTSALLNWTQTPLLARCWATFFSNFKVYT